MDKITAKEYAGIHNVSPDTVRKWCNRGKMKTATRPGRDWLIDADEVPPTDRRVKSGKYIKNNNTTK